MDNVPAILLPPSPLYPIAGAGLGYLLTQGEKKPYVMILGAVLGIAVNVATRSIQLQAERAQASGASSFKTSLGSELLAATLGQKSAGEPGTQVSGRLMRAHG